MSLNESVLTVALSIVSAVATAVVSMLSWAYMRGRREAQWVTREEMQDAIHYHREHCNEVFKSRFDSIDQRLDRIEKKLDSL